MNKTKQIDINKKHLITLVCVLLAVIIGLSYINRSKVRNFFTRDDETPKTSENLDAPNDVNQVDYSPSDPTDNDAINEQKKNADTNSGTPTNTNIIATITNTRVVNSLAQVSVLVSGTKTGTCKLTLFMDATTVEKIVNIATKEAVTTCENFDIPVSELSAGSWKVSVELLSNNQRSPVAESTLQVGS